MKIFNSVMYDYNNVIDQIFSPIHANTRDCGMVQATKSKKPIMLPITFMDGNTKVNILKLLS